MRLMLGNVGDETALRNICEAHHLYMDEREYMYATNSFYYNAQEFNTIHHKETEEVFCELIESGAIVSTKDGFIWVDCV